VHVLVYVAQAAGLIAISNIFACTYIYTENEIDGEGFLLLTDEDIGQMVKQVAIRKKLIKQHQHLLNVSDISYTYLNMHVN